MRLLLLGISMALSAQKPSQDWNVLRGVFPAQEAIVKPLDGKRLKGSITSVTDTVIVVRTTKGAVMIERGLVEWVSVKKSERHANARTGALLGAGIPLGMGIVFREAKASLTLAVFGAVLGGLCGSFGTTQVRIYRQQGGRP